MTLMSMVSLMHVRFCQKKNPTAVIVCTHGSYCLHNFTFFSHAGSGTVIPNLAKFCGSLRIWFYGTAKFCRSPVVPPVKEDLTI
jgi:hypothetical protein